MNRSDHGRKLYALPGLEDGVDSARSLGAQGRDDYIRLFPWLPPCVHDEPTLAVLAKAVAVAGNDERPGASLAAGDAFFAQFVGHDMSFDVSTQAAALTPGSRPRNARSVRLDLDSLYGLGPVAQPYLFAPRDPSMFRLAPISLGDGSVRDLPRLDDLVPVMADPRNADNLVLMQLQVSLQRVHNVVVAKLGGGRGPAVALLDARRELQLHLQWLLVHDLLARLLDLPTWQRCVAADMSGGLVVDGGARMPLEFSRAVFRLHSAVRSAYRLYRGGETVPVDDLMTWPQTRLRDVWVIDWRHFLDEPGQVAPERARPFGPGIVPALDEFVILDGRPGGLARRTLEGGMKAGLPSGQNVARATGIPVLSARVLAASLPEAAGLPVRVWEDTPLWLYTQCEAHAVNGGLRLGPVGSFIVGKTLIGILDADPDSFRNVAGGWSPASRGRLGLGDDAKLLDLIRVDPEWDFYT